MISSHLFMIMFGVSGFLLTSAYIVYKNTTSSLISNKSMLKVSNAIKEGAYAYLSKQYQIVTFIGLLCSAIIWFTFGTHVALTFILGAFLSGFAGAIAMMVAVDANVFTTQSALDGFEKGDTKTALSSAFNTSIRAGGIVGFIVNGFGIFGLAILLLLTYSYSIQEFIQACLGFCLGVSLISVFARLGGGIFTKAADIGADLVGKIEKNIPEDDPRNPAVIADNVGDNVGDCAGMAADVFETYSVSLIAAIQISLITFGQHAFDIFIPYIVSIMSICSVVSIFTVVLAKLKNSIINSIYAIVNKTIIISSFIIAIWTYLFFEGKPAHIFTYHDHLSSAHLQFTSFSLTLCALIGFVLTFLIMRCTDYYTCANKRPVQEISQASQTGHATNVIYGLSVGMESVVWPVLLVISAIVGCYKLAGICGIAIAVTSMISLTAVIMTLDAYGPITDNAGGIAEMAKLPSKIRTVTDALDAVGNTTKAITKGYAIGSAALAMLVLFFTYVSDAKITNWSQLSLLNPYVLAGLLMGGMLPFSFSASAMKSVGKIGGLVVLEVREQLERNPGILLGTHLPNYARTIKTITVNSLKAMIVPALMPVIAPLLLTIFVLFCDYSQAVFALGGMIMGVLITGVFLALMMTNSGGAWDNSKKLIESGEYGGKGSLAHQAAITGDTIGDPCKDTAGPAINPMIKVVGIVSLLIASFLSKN